MLAPDHRPSVGVAPGAVTFEAASDVSGIIVATPCYGGMCADAYMHGVVDLHMECQRRGINVKLVTLRNESLVQRARNSLVAHFLASSASHMIFIDADIGFDGRSVLRLVGHDRAIIGAPYRKKDLARVDWALNALPSEDGMAERDPRTGAFRVNHLATGFLCIRRDVLQTLFDRHPEWRYEYPVLEGPPGEWRRYLSSIFDCWIDPVSKSYLSEDYGFCVRAQKEGFEIWCDPGIVLEHHGSAAFIADPTNDFHG